MHKKPIPSLISIPQSKELALWVALLTCSGEAAVAQGEEDITSLSFADLMELKISSVSKREETVMEASAAIYVITREAIRNAGATTLPEALRLDPRLQISRINGTEYAIGVRGFTTDTNNKLLVLIDGRTVYTSLFSGVFWDHQDLLLEDVERIEVVSGPGATLWGTNAVNGVINVITRKSSDTAGWLAAAHAGNNERGARARYGTAVGRNGHLRIYGKLIETDTHKRTGGERANDGAKRVQAGFRTDWSSRRNHFTVQGDVYHGQGEDRGIVNIPLLGGEIPLGDVEPSGNNLLARWQTTSPTGSDLRVQAYWDYFKRRDPFMFQPKSSTWDVELQHGVPFGQHRLMWGGGYRYTEDEVDHGLATYFIPDSRSLEWMNAFGMGELQITEALDITLGLRLEHNDFTGMEYLPTARISWNHSPSRLIWAALSRAVRAPSRFDRDVFYGVGPTGPWFVEGGPNFVSEVANVLEIGYRRQPIENLTYSITTYYHDWDRLRSATPASVTSVQLENKIEGEVYGVQLWAHYQLLRRWQLSAGGARVYKNLRLKPDSRDPRGADNPTLANDADYVAQARSTLEINDDSFLQISIRHVAELKNQQVPSYTSVDANYSWQFHPAFALAVTAQNLMNDDHYEYGDRPAGVLFGRTAWLTLTWEP